ncbi:MAG: ABC transporter permease [Halobacteriales archaeon]
MTSDDRAGRQDESPSIEILPKHKNANNQVIQILREARLQFRTVANERFGILGLSIVAFFLILGLVGPMIAPYEPDAKFANEDGTLMRFSEPSADHPFGTTALGRDVFSQTLVSARVSIIIGLIGAAISIFIGTTVGIVSAYYGGWVDDALMRFTDIMYGIPFLPFIIVMVLMIGPGLFNIIIAISLILWRSTARVVRSQVLSIKERPYIEAAHAVGVSDTRMILRHLLPNVLPLVTLYGAFNVATSILTEASIAFLGFGDPTRISWGKMLFQAYTASAMRTAWWWVLPPGIAITLLVIAVFMIARAYEAVTNPDLQQVAEG